MKIARYTIHLVCVLMASVTAIFLGCAYFAHPDGRDQLMQVVFCALCFLAGIGTLAFVVQLRMKRTGSILSYLFFGFLAGLMATNFASEVLSGTRYTSSLEMLANYGLMVVFFALAVAGAVLVQATERQWRIAEQSAAPLPPAPQPGPSDGAH